MIRYIVRSKINPSLILTVSSGFKPDSMCGPGGWCAKLYKTRRGAENANGTAHACDRYGVEAGRGADPIQSHAAGACSVARVTVPPNEIRDAIAVCELRSIPDAAGWLRVKYAWNR